MRNSILITGSSGLIGSEAVVFFDRMGWTVHGVDNNLRREFFGADGDTTPNLRRLQRVTRRFVHHPLDLRHRRPVLDLVRTVRPGAILHCASQPSHDLARDRPFDDFDVNAAATLTLLEAARQYAPESPFIFMSTNKVYGDAPNERPLRELATRWDYADPNDYDGIDETCRIDGTLHSLFGVSKTAADLMVQEYGRYFGMPTVCFRGGCLTGPQHAGAEMHGFLAYLARALAEGRTYRIYGYKGKQVRDNLHACDVCRAFWEFIQNPRSAAVYNLGGGRANSISVVEAITRLEDLMERKLRVEYRDENRVGDHICYISNLGRLRRDYPRWEVTHSIDTILEQLAAHCAGARRVPVAMPVVGQATCPLSIIIVNTNHRELLHRGLMALENAELPAGTEVIVVDNASTDGSAEMVERDFPHARVLRQTTRRGPAANYNIGFAAARGKYLLVLNEDAEVEADALMRLYACLEANPRVGLAAPRLVYPDGRPQQSCNRFPGFSSTFKRLLLQSVMRGPWVQNGYAEEIDERPFEPDWIMATCLMIRRQALEQVGPYDEQFEVFYEEVDLCRRFWAAGWRVAWRPDAVVRHHHGVSNFTVPSERDITFRLLLYQSRYRYFRKHHGALFTTAVRAVEAALFGILALKTRAEALLPTRRDLAGMKARLYTTLGHYAVRGRGCPGIPQG